MQFFSKLIKPLLLPLILPLSILILFCLIINYFFSCYGFFINLSTELIGIIITVFYVDYILKKKESENWIQVEKKVSEELRKFINITITSIRSIFNDYDFIEYLSKEGCISNPIDIQLMNKKLIEFSKEILGPLTFDKISLINQSDWKKLKNLLFDLQNDTDRLLTIFGTKLAPQQYEYLLAIQVTLKSITSSISLVPDILGVPDDELPPNTNAKSLKEFFNESIAKEINNLLNNCCELSNSLND